MAASFACPECGRRIRLTGLTPGREVICPRCATRVVVPFLPRSLPRPREIPAARPIARRAGRWDRSAQRRRRIWWATALGVMALIGLGTAWAVRQIAAGARDGRERVLAELLAASDRAAAAHDPGGAFREIEAALIRARQIDPPGSARLVDLRERRHRLARAEVAARLARLGTLSADQAAGEAQILSERGERDPALAPLSEAIAHGVETTTRRQVEHDHGLAEADLQAGRGPSAFERAGRAYRRANALRDRAAAQHLRDEAAAVATQAVRRFGVVVRPPPEPSTSPAAPADRPADRPVVVARSLWLDALAARGYLIEPAHSDWGELWATDAPYRADFTVTETNQELYQQSQNRATQIEAQFTLTERGQTRWDHRLLARTRAPMLDLPAFLAGRLATASRRDAEIERRLRDDARSEFRTQTERILRGLPAAIPPRAADPPP